MNFYDKGEVFSYEKQSFVLWCDCECTSDTLLLGLKNVFVLENDMQSWLTGSNKEQTKFFEKWVYYSIQINNSAVPYPNKQKENGTNKQEGKIFGMSDMKYKPVSCNKRT